MCEFSMVNWTITTTTDEAWLLQWDCRDEIPMKRTHWLLAERPQSNLTFPDNHHSKAHSVEKTIREWKPNEFNLIKTKLKEGISRTRHIQYVQLKATFAGHFQATNLKQRLGLNIPPAKTNGFITTEFVDFCHSNVLCQARMTGILWLPSSLSLAKFFKFVAHFQVLFCSGRPVALIGQAQWSMSNVNSSSKNPAKLHLECGRWNQRAKPLAVEHYIAEYISS